jgi:basic amino acid/polyamine antiporter, APA family
MNTPAAGDADATRAALPRVLGFRDVVLLTLGQVIGSGIFIVPATVLTFTGGEMTPAVLVWVIGGVLQILGAWTYAEMGAMKPQAGGIYVYMKDAYGDFVAFMYGWALFLVIGSATIATLAVAFSGYLGQFVELTPTVAKTVSVGAIVVMTVLNVWSTRQSANTLNWSTAIKVGAILIMSALLLAKGNGLSEAAPPGAPHGMALLTAMGAAMIGVLWAYEGWQYVTMSAGEVIDPQRTFARSFVVGTALLIVLYVLANFAYVAALGVTRAMGSERIAAEAVTAIMGGGAGKLIAAAILISMFSAAHATFMTASRVFFAMARDGLFFNRLAEVHPQWKTPAFSVICLGGWSAVLAASGTFEQLLTYVVFTGWIFYGLAAAAIFQYRRRHPDVPRPFRTPGYPVTPILFVVTAAAIVLNTLWVQPKESAFGIGILLLGLPAFWFWKRRK